MITLRKLLQRTPSVRAILLLAIMMTVAMVLSAAAILVDLRQKELAHARGELSTLTRILAEQTSRTFDGVALTMHMARERLSDNFGQGLELDSRPVSLLLKARSAGLPQIKSIFVIDRDGFGVNSSRDDFIVRLPMAQREFFRAFSPERADDLFISRPEQARVDGRWAFYISMPFDDASADLRGVLVAAMSIEYFESLYASIDLDFVSRIRLLSSDGFLLAGKPSDDTMYGKVGAHPPALDELKKHAEDKIVESIENESGRVRMATYRQVSGFPLVVSASVDEEEALTPWRGVVKPVAAGLVLIVSMLWLTTLLLLRNLLRKGALEAAKREDDSRLRYMLQSVNDAILTLDADRHIVVFNESAVRMFGIPAAQAIGQDIGAFCSGRLGQLNSKEMLAQLERGWQSPNGLTLLTHIDLHGEGNVLPVELTLSLTSFRGGQILTAIFRDLSERERSERELLETNRQLQELTAALQNTREEQRAKISRELHDELGQQLTGMRMEVSWLGGRLPNDPPELRHKIAAIKKQIDQTIDSVRRISAELRPLVLDDLGFSAAATWYVDQFSERTGVPVTLRLPAMDPERGDAVATALFRILQECLTNIARHAEASEIDVTLTTTPERWALSVRDNGVGFEYNPGQKDDIGLIGMRERAQMLGGNFVLTTAPGQGTTVQVSIPASASKDVP